MPFKGFGGIWRPLKRPGRARGGGTPFFFLFFFLPPSTPPPSRDPEVFLISFSSHDPLALCL